MCHETALLQTWPEGGPKLLWRLNGLGTGFSSVSIVGGRLFTMGDRAGEDGAKAQFVLAFDLAARKELWVKPSRHTAGGDSGRLLRSAGPEASSDKEGRP